MTNGVEVGIWPQSGTQHEGPTLGRGKGHYTLSIFQGSGLHLHSWNAARRWSSKAAEKKLLLGLLIRTKK